MRAYMLTLAVFIPISGWVAGRLGSRSVFATAIGIFTLASVLCGISTTLRQFILMRILQGIGGATALSDRMNCYQQPRLLPVLWRACRSLVSTGLKRSATDLASH
jgi:MFS family permease